jgi:ABC-2 type transport system ATP-binding protein
MVEPGEIVGVLGANGAGKTTLLKIIATLIAPTSGSVVVDGWDVQSEMREAKAAVAYCFTEERSFYWRLTGRQNLEFFAALDDLHGAAALQRIDDLAERLGIGPYLELPFSRFSSGIKQRFALVRAMLASPRVLLLDEPTRSIDPVEARSIWSLIREDLVEDSGVSVILVTHQVVEAVAVCDRISIMEAGRLAVNVPPADLKRAVDGLLGFTLTVEGLPVSHVPRLRTLRGIREVSYSEHNGEQQLEVWCDDDDAALGELVSATTLVGARVRGFDRSAPVNEILQRLARPNGVHVS